MHTVYVYIENEAVDVWRPVEAEHVGLDTYLLIGPTPDDEIWQFPPGSIVKCKMRQFEDGQSGLVAIEATEIR